MLIGEYRSKITTKNRTAFPKKFRNELGDKLIISKGYENCLIILNTSLWKTLIKNIEQTPFLDRSVQDTKRFLAGGAFEIELDSQGRFIVNDIHKEFAKLREEIIFVGILDWVEVWNKGRWEKKLKDLNKNAQEIADKLQK